MLHMCHNKYPIFENPTLAELDTFKTYRFIADQKTKKVYVCNDLTHALCWKTIGDERTVKDMSLLLGQMKLNGQWHSPLLYHAMDPYVDAQTILNQDWNWMKKYIPTIDEFLKQMRIRTLDLKEHIKYKVSLIGMEK